MTSDPYPGDGISATLHVILLDKKFFFLWHFSCVACLAFIKIFNLTRTSTTVYYVTQQRTFKGEQLNERFYETPFLFVFDPKTHFLPLFFTLNEKFILWYSLCASFKIKITAILTIFIFVCFWPENTHFSTLFTLNLNLFLWYSSCASFKTRTMVVLTIFILEQEKITFFRWFWPHQFSPWPQNASYLTLNLSSRSNLETCLILFKSLIFGKCNKGSFVTVSCSVQILWWILLPLPHYFPIFWKSATFDTRNFRPLYKLNVQEIRLPTSRKLNGGYCSFIWYQETFLHPSARKTPKIRPISELAHGLWPQSPFQLTMNQHQLC